MTILFSIAGEARTTGSVYGACTMQYAQYLENENAPARRALVPHAGRRATFHGVVETIARRHTRRGRKHLICVRNITDTAGVPVFDHYWLTFGERFAALDLQTGERVAFRVQVDRQLDGEYTLSFPTRVCRL